MQHMNNMCNDAVDIIFQLLTIHYYCLKIEVVLSKNKLSFTMTFILDIYYKLLSSTSDQI